MTRFFPSLDHRVLDIEPESEDEETILERRRQLRQAIVQKYATPGTEPPSLTISPAGTPSSSADSVTVGDAAARDFEATVHEEEERLKERGGVEDGVVKKGEEGGREEKERVRSSLQAMKAAVRNGDMFCEGGDMFGEKYLVCFVVITYTCSHMYTVCCTVAGTVDREIFVLRTFCVKNLSSVKFS